jgi:cation diffusion facilitator family transporter
MKLPAHPSRAAQYRQASQAALLGFVVNLALGVVKLVSGLVGGSFALIADAVNSLGDVLTSLIVLIALYVAQRPPDEEHPYGHTRAEAIAGSNVGLLLIISACFVGWEALQRLTNRGELPAAWMLWVAATNVVIKEALYRYKMAVGRRTGSSAIVANAWDHRSDAFCSLAVLAGLGAVRFGGPNWHWADDASAIFVVAVIAWTAVGLIRTSASELMDVQAEPDMVNGVRDAALSIDGVKGVEKLWVRKSGIEYFVDIHLEVDPDMTVAEGHTIGHQVKDSLLDQFPMLRDVLVHLEPFPRHDQQTA